MYVTEGRHEDFYTQLTPHLQLTLKGIQKSQATSYPQSTCLPITLKIMQLQSINGLLTEESHSYDNLGSILPSLFWFPQGQQIHYSQWY